MKPQISIVTIAAQNFDSTVGFYVEVLGWKPFEKIADTIAFFNLGGVVLSVCSKKTLDQDVGAKLNTRPPLGVTFAQNLASEAAVDELFGNLQSKGVTIVKRPTRADWGGYSGYFSDPEGHLWEVAHNPQFSYDSSGKMIIPDA